MNKVTSLEFQRGFGRVRALALHAPVVVTNHGRDDLVVLSAGEYRRLTTRDRRAILAADMPETDLAMLESVQIPDAAKALNYEAD